MAVLNGLTTSKALARTFRASRVSRVSAVLEPAHGYDFYEGIHQSGKGQKSDEYE